MFVEFVVMEVIGGVDGRLFHFVCQTESSGCFRCVFGSLSSVQMCVA